VKVARLGASDEVEGLDEEFLFHLNRGSELLSRGDAEGARTALERARERRPKDAKVLGLLGQAFYRLSRFDDAGAVWQKLVDDNPVEPAARVNLGLARLKAKRYPDALKQLEIALDLNPEHRKAMGYLGLAFLESGDAGRARGWFEKAGSDHMVARCDEVLAGRAVAAAPEPIPEGPAEPVEVPEPLQTSAPDPAEPGRAAPAARELSSFAAERLVRPPPGRTFSMSGEVLAVAVRGELRVRLDGIFASRGAVAFAAEMKRFRGRATERPFGEGETRMHRASGSGTLLFRGAGRRFTALELGGEAAYFREDALFGFEDALAFENGRVPSTAAELNLVHLRGTGTLLLATAGEPVALDVALDAPVRVAVRALVGWVGTLTPRISAPADEPDDASPVMVELTGEGRVLADPGAPGRPP
jgi:tetratricopeptide (TPR) repeat protein